MGAKSPVLKLKEAVVVAAARTLGPDVAKANIGVFNDAVNDVVDEFLTSPDHADERDAVVDGIGGNTLAGMIVGAMAADVVAAVVEEK